MYIFVCAELLSMRNIQFVSLCMERVDPSKPDCEPTAYLHVAAASLQHLQTPPQEC